MPVLGGYIHGFWWVNLLSYIPHFTLELLFVKAPAIAGCEKVEVKRDVDEAERIETERHEARRIEAEQIETKRGRVWEDPGPKDRRERGYQDAP